MHTEHVSFFPMPFKNLLPAKQPIVDAAPGPADGVIAVLTKVSIEPHACSAQSILKSYKEFTREFKNNDFSAQQLTQAEQKFVKSLRDCYAASIRTIFDHDKSYEEVSNAFTIVKVTTVLLAERAAVAGQNASVPEVQVTTFQGKKLTFPYNIPDSIDLALKQVTAKLARTAVEEAKNPLNESGLQTKALEIHGRIAGKLRANDVKGELGEARHALNYGVTVRLGGIVRSTLAQTLLYR